MRPRSRTLVAASALFVAGPAAARPYYAAKKGLSCAACHVQPAGGGPRWTTPSSPVRINDAINLGADFRVLSSKTGGGHEANPSSFNASEIALYIVGSPAERLHLVYENNRGATQAGYGMWATDRWGPPAYVRAGRFRLPYGLQVDDIDQVTASYTKNLATGFSPPSQAGFDMTNNTNDTGVEAGLNPKEGYFVNLAVTNGQTAGGAARNEGKAWTARAGVVTRLLAVGVTAFRNHPLGLGNFHEDRWGAFGWTSLWRLALLGEWGGGRDKPNVPPQTVLHRRAGFVELDADVWDERWLLKLRYDFANPNTTSSANARRRYTLGVEWFVNETSSVEAQWRVPTESPELKNNQGLIAAHVWF